MCSIWCMLAEDSVNDPGTCCSSIKLYFLCVKFIYFLLLWIIWSRYTERILCPPSNSCVIMLPVVGRPCILPNRSDAPVTERFPLHDDQLYLHFTLNLYFRLISNVPVGSQQFPAQTAVTQLDLAKFLVPSDSPMWHAMLTNRNGNVVECRGHSRHSNTVQHCGVQQFYGCTCITAGLLNHTTWHTRTYEYVMS